MKAWIKKKKLMIFDVPLKPQERQAESINFYILRHDDF